MITATTLSDFNSIMAQIPKGEKICLVPTMGALHQGHLSLVKEGLAITPYTVVTIFVNPTQFNDSNDLANYPRELESDIAKLESCGAFLLLAPSKDEIYPHSSAVAESEVRVRHKEPFDLDRLDRFGEGPFRPGHFQGVAQVVTRLFDIVKPHYALFGEKDFQQLAIIKRVTKLRNYNITVIGVPTVREPDGLAMSSRNQLLNSAERKASINIFKSLSEANTLLKEGGYSPKELTTEISKRVETEPLLKVEYVELLDSHTLQPVEEWSKGQDVQLCIAAYCGTVRLIDNIKLS